MMGRSTIPLMEGDEGNTSYLNNVMSNNGGQITSRQQMVFLNRLRNERKYVTNAFVLPEMINFNNAGKNGIGNLPVGVKSIGSKNMSNLTAINAAGVIDRAASIVYTYGDGKSNAQYMQVTYDRNPGRTNINTVIQSATNLGW